jgi:hypothetical protein
MRNLTEVAVLLVLGIAVGCSRQPKVEGLKRLDPNAQNAGFLSSYAKLAPNPRFENALTYVNNDPMKNIHRYYAVIVEPVQLYVSTNADVSKIQDRGRTALAGYFQNAITRAVEDAFPVTTEPGPLVLRLRTALIGVDVGAGNRIDIGKVGVESELVDSVTGEQIAAAIDKQNLGVGATVGSEKFIRDEKTAVAMDAFDGWASRLRAFLDSAHELSKEDAERADASYRPYGEPVATK